MSCNNEMSFFPSNLIIQTSYQDDHTHHSPSLCPIPQDFHGFASFLGKRSSDMEVGNNMNGEEEYSDDGSQLGEKKRRLNMEQVKTLEKSFELGKKLEPERKMQLARALSLQPRQIAIWFQNRRARWKTKQLEKDYDTLKQQFDTLKAENDLLQMNNQKLQAEIMGLKSRDQTESINLNKETEGSCSNRSENISGDIRPAEIDSQFIGGNHHPPSSPTTTTMQFFQNSSTEQRMVKEENSISNIFSGIDEQHSGFWPWLDQQQPYN